MADANPFVSWAHQCEWICRICNRKDFKWNCQFHNHINIEHGMSDEEYTKAHGSFFKMKVWHRCKICNKEILHRPSNLFHHMQVHHNMTLMDYYFTYIRSTTHKCLSCNGEVERNLSALNNHFNEQCNITLSEYYETFIANLDGGAINLWADQCKYKCKICLASDLTFGRFEYHMKKQHGMSMSDHRMHDNGETKLQYHECQICHEKIVHNNLELTDHMKKHHGIAKLGIYAIIFDVINCDYYVCQICRVHVRRDPSILGTHFKDHHSLSIMDYYQKHLKHPEKSESEERLCSYTCVICHQDGFSKLQFKLHIETKHNLSCAEYLKLHGMRNRKCLFHTCRLCGRTLNLRTQTLSKHLRVHHGITSLDAYLQIYVEDSNTEEGSSDRNLEIDDEVVLEDEQSDSQNQSSLKEVLEPGCHQCQVCKDEVKRDLGILENHMQDQHQLSLLEYYNRYLSVIEWSSVAWGDQCTYKCEICKAKNLTSSKLQNHVSKEHGMSKPDYESKYGLSVGQSVKYHTCAICSSSLQHNYEVLRSHIRRSHNFSSLKMYCLVFICSIESEMVEQPKLPTNHKCSICGNEVELKLNIVRKHLKKEHKMDLEDYCNKVLADSNISITVWADNGPGMCKICKRPMTGNEPNMRRHLMTKHNISLAKYKAKYAQNASLHPCGACGKNIVFKYRRLWKHAVRTHKLPSLSVYYVLYVFGMKNLVRMEKLYVTSPCQPAAPKIENVSCKMKKQPEVDQRHKCNICGINVRKKLMSVSKHLKAKHNITLKDYCEKVLVDSNISITAWADSGTGTCKICNCFSSSHSLDMGRHLSKEHNISQACYNAKYKLDAPLHPCRICGKKIRFKHERLRYHIVNIHKFPSVSVYYVLYVFSIKKKKMPTKVSSQPAPELMSFVGSSSPSAEESSQGQVSSRRMTLRKRRVPEQIIISSDEEDAPLQKTPRNRSLRINEPKPSTSAQSVSPEAIPSTSTTSQMQPSSQNDQISIDRIFQNEARPGTLVTFTSRNKTITIPAIPVRLIPETTCNIQKFTIQKVNKPNGSQHPNMNSMATTPTLSDKYGTTSAKALGIPKASPSSFVPNTPMVMVSKEVALGPLKTERHQENLNKEEILNVPSASTNDTIKIEEVSIFDDPIEENPVTGHGNDERNFSTGWMNKCTFYCSICEENCCKVEYFESVKDFEDHSVLEHSLTYEAFVVKEGNPCASPEFFKCKICQNETLHDEKMIRKHLEIHSMTPYGYKSKFN